jgi:hypothetical protein
MLRRRLGFQGRASSHRAVSSRRRVGRQQRPTVKSGDLSCGYVVIYGSSEVSCVKRICTVLCAI